MNDDIKLVDGIISDYFNSIKDLFHYRIKNNWKIGLSHILFYMSVLLFIVNIIPILPSNYDNWLGYLFDIAVKQFDFIIKENTFWSRWGVGSLLSFLILMIFYLFKKYWDMMENKRALDKRLLAFCYVFALRQELKRFMVNERLEHLDNCKIYADKSIHKLKYIYVHKGETGYEQVDITKLQEDAKKYYSWFELNKNADENIKAISSIKTKLTERLNQKTELHSLFKAIDFLILYEYSKIKSDTMSSNDTEMGNLTDNYFTGFATEINQLKAIDPIKQLEDSKKRKIQNAINSIISLFVSKNIIIVFISWLLLLTILFVTVALIGMNIFNITFDSTIMVGLLSVPFLGAIIDI